MPDSQYKLVRVSGGAHSIYSLAHAETFHPVVGPVVEAEALYVRQLGLLDRLRQHTGEFVVWDVGLGAAANALTVVRATKDIPCWLRVVSFDHTLEPLEFALEHKLQLGYLQGYEAAVASLLTERHLSVKDRAQAVEWDVHVADFPSLLASAQAEEIPKPHAIMFDAFSPAKNPAMWTAPLFARLFQLLDPAKPCALPTYSRSTLLRVTLLLAGFYVGVGHATGEKDETTIAANTLDLIKEPLDARWLERARRSTSAEPLWEPLYRQAKLAPETWERLKHHRQFS
ncbi:MAG TPA: MnmC family methyltransferase [Candidatus Dormibacteraeota bacterium]|nr:MnmC family methyltransferase [Candidatus Dormibacteraeota bacterium]